MFFISGTMTMNPDVIDNMVADVAAMVDTVRAEDGCLHYSLLVEDKAAGLVNVVEMWRDDDALGVHFSQPHITAFFAKYFPEMRDSTLKIYDIAGERPLPL